MFQWPATELVVGVLLATSFTTVGLVALWAATSRGHWFVRAAILIGAMSPLLFVPAYEPFLLFALEAAIVLTCVRLWQWFAKTGESHRSPRFALRSLFLFTLIVAAMLAVATHVANHLGPQSTEAWTTMLLDGAAAGVAVLLGGWMATAKRKWIAWPTALVACLGLALAVAWHDWIVPMLLLPADSDWPPRMATFMTILGTPQSHPQLIWMLILPAVTLLTLLTLAAVRVLAEPSPRPSPTGRGRLSKRALAAAVLIVAIAAVPAIVLWDLLHPLPLPSFTTPNPNGFEPITAAARAFSASPILSTMAQPKTTAQLAAEVAKFGPALDQIRLGLSQGFRIRQWPRAGDPITEFDMFPAAIQEARAVARGLGVMVESAQKQGRYADAVKLSLDLLRLGAALPRDGIYVDFLAGLAIESIGLHSLYPSIAHLSPDECRATIEAFDELERRRVPLEDSLHRDRIWSQHALGWHGHVWQLVQRIAPRPDVIAARSETLRRYQAMRRLLMTELALRGYEVQNGSLPDALIALVPAWLDQVPLDPYDPAGGELRYARTGDGYLLYSIGRDGRDNRGRARYPAAGLLDDNQDLRLDVYFGPEDEADASATPTSVEDRAAPDSAGEVKKSDQN